MNLRRHEPAEEEFPEEHFTMPAENVDPHPASAKQLGLFTAIVSLVVIAAVIAVIITAITTTGTADRLQKLVDQQTSRGQLRDRQHTQTENQIGTQQKQIKKLTDELRATQVRDNQAVCTLIIGLVQANKTQHPNEPVDSTLISPFLTKYGCTVPPNLFP